MPGPRWDSRRSIQRRDWIARYRESVFKRAAKYFPVAHLFHWFMVAVRVHVQRTKRFPRLADRSEHIRQRGLM